MHQLFCETHAESVSISKYSQIFNTFNLKFKAPKLDTCHKCDTLNAKLKHMEKTTNEYSSLIDEQTRHHDEAALAYESKKNDKLLAKSNDNISTLAFDLQQCLPTPYLNTSVCFYKRQLYTYNLTVHDCANNSSHCFMWHEAISKRGANQIASFLLKYIKKNGF